MNRNIPEGQSDGSPNHLFSPSRLAVATKFKPRWHLHPAAHFNRYLRSWDSVLSQSPHPPLLDAEFVGVLIKIFGKGSDLLGICGDASAPTAMGIFRRKRMGAWEALQIPQGPNGIWVHRPEVSFEDVLPSLMQSLPGMPLVLGIPKKDPAVHPRPHDSAKLKTLNYLTTASIFVNRPFEEYWSTRDKKVRYEIGRRLKRLSEAGVQPRLEVVTDSSEVPSAVDAYGNIEASGWKGAAGTAVQGGNRQGLFYRTVLREYCTAGKGRIYRYWFGDELVAMQLCIVGSAMLVFLKTTYREDYRRFGPGILMKHAIFEHVFREGKLKSIEFYGSLIDWQRKWYDDARTMYHVNCYRWPWVPKLQDLLNELRSRLRSSMPAEDDDSTD